jgi:Cu/Ag efflux protein CusF
MKILNRFTKALAVTTVAAALSFAQAPAGKKAHVFKGRVEGINVKEGTLKVNNEKVEGWMDPMTMDYKVDNPEVLKTIKTGDKITATVYDDDMSLHKVQVAKDK